MTQGNLKENMQEIWNSKIRELLDALDTPTPDPRALEDKPFLLSIEEAFFIHWSKGTVAIGHVERGQLRINHELDLVGLGPTRRTIAIDFEQSHKKCERLVAGNAAGMLIRGFQREDVRPGQVLAAPGSIQSYVKFRAKLAFCTPDETEMDQLPLSGTDYLFLFRSIEVKGTLWRQEGSDPISSEEIMRVAVELETNIAMEPGTRFLLRRNGCTHGYGIVTEPLS